MALVDIKPTKTGQTRLLPPSTPQHNYPLSILWLPAGQGLIIAIDVVPLDFVNILATSNGSGFISRTVIGGCDLLVNGLFNFETPKSLSLFFHAIKTVFIE